MVVLYHDLSSLLGNKFGMIAVVTYTKDYQKYLLYITFIPFALTQFHTSDNKHFSHLHVQQFRVFMYVYMRSSS